jgi:hypothetical protein
MKKSSGIIQVHQDETKLALMLNKDVIDNKLIEKLMDAFIEGKATAVCMTAGMVAFKDGIVNLSDENQIVIMFRITE